MVRAILLLLAIAIGHAAPISSYAGSLKLNESSYAKELTYTVPHVPDPEVVVAIRDFDGLDKFPWQMHDSLTPINSTHDCFTMTFLQEWPKEKLNYMTIDFLIYTKNPRVRVKRIRAIDFQTHLQVQFNKATPPELLMYPVSWTDFSLSSGFTNLAISYYQMYAIHFMHMHDGQMDHEMSDKMFQGQWMDFVCVIVDIPVMPQKPDCNTTNKWEVSSLTNYPISPECGYFVGLKSIYDYHSSDRFSMSKTQIQFKNSKDSKFGVMAFPIPIEGFEDHREFWDSPSEVVVPYQPNILMQTFQEYPIALYIMIISALAIVGLLIYAKCAIMRRRQDSMTFRDQVTAPSEKQERETPEMVVNCTECRKPIELVRSELSFIDNIKCDSCQNKVITIED